MDDDDNRGQVEDGEPDHPAGRIRIDRPGRLAQRAALLIGLGVVGGLIGAGDLLGCPTQTIVVTVP